MYWLFINFKGMLCGNVIFPEDSFSTADLSSRYTVRLTFPRKGIVEQRWQEEASGDVILQPS